MESSGESLFIILDLTPSWWGRRRTTQQQTSDSGYSSQSNSSSGNLSNAFSLTALVDAVTAFTCSHLMLDHRNRVHLIASTPTQNRLVYPDVSSICDSSRHTVGHYDRFASLALTVCANVEALVEAEVVAQRTECLLASALCMTLCMINKEETTKQAKRVLIVKAGPDDPMGFMTLMNCAFTAQKRRLVVDACVLADSRSCLLQQVCDISGGLYFEVPQHGDGLLQYLVWVFLPRAALRAELPVMPDGGEVDYRTACFCHRNKLIEIGYVCSVCLSVFCEFNPICPTCRSSLMPRRKAPLAKSKTLPTAVTTPKPTPLPAASPNSRHTPSEDVPILAGGKTPIYDGKNPYGAPPRHEATLRNDSHAAVTSSTSSVTSSQATTTSSVTSSITSAVTPPKARDDSANSVDRYATLSTAQAMISGLKRRKPGAGPVAKLQRTDDIVASNGALTTSLPAPTDESPLGSTTGIEAPPAIRPALPAHNGVVTALPAPPSVIRLQSGLKNAVIVNATKVTKPKS